MILNAESKIAFVWGNGESRRKADKMYSNFWGDMRMIGTHYGCNAMYRDMVLDHLVVIDPDMLDELSKDKNKYADHYPVWTGYRNPKQCGSKVKNIPIPFLSYVLLSELFATVRTVLGDFFFIFFQKLLS